MTLKPGEWTMQCKYCKTIFWWSGIGGLMPDCPECGQIAMPIWFTEKAEGK